MDRKIIFRADGGPSIGMGHFTRTLALAEMLNEHFHCIFATRQPSEYQISEIAKVCSDRIDLPNDDLHFDKFLEFLKGDEIVVLDNYFFTTEYQKAIKSKGCKLVCIDDLHDKHYVADVVINHALTDKKLFSVENYTKLFIGLEYALIRKEFFLNYNKKRIDNSILICMGGGDYNRLTQKILNFLILKRVTHKYKVFVLVGCANDNAQEIEEICRKHQFTFLKCLTAQDMSQIFEMVEYAILPASTITIEALYKNIKIIGGYYIDNQFDFFKAISQSSFVYPIGNLKTSSNYGKIIDGLTSDFNSFKIPKKKQFELIKSIKAL